jgi:hypothetical protein
MAFEVEIKLFPLQIEIENVCLTGQWKCSAGYNRNKSPGFKKSGKSLWLVE